ncbi:unnamed protein product [Trypanosoma congolense IL3000]|uniref:WGS project CAEQ00000000 data, annotated contig 2073 n=1 Tax=Trypanosoma congolense (strain IL3000) TaxID=1068625 RepID=F9WB84_TRYCI|nr:unnamed protein product [Trypanosoma congolense IL3000]
MQLLGKFLDSFLPPLILFDVVGWVFQESSESRIGVAGSVCFPIFLSQKVNEANVFPGFECLPEDPLQLTVPSSSWLTLCAWSAGYLICELVTFLVASLHGHASACCGDRGCLRASRTASSKMGLGVQANNVLAPRRAQSQRVMMPSPTRHRMSLIVLSCKRSNVC